MAANNMPPPASPARQSTSDGNRIFKRKTREPEPSVGGIFTFLTQDATDIERFLDPDDYVIVCIPKGLANSLQTFLDKSAKTLDGLNIKTPGAVINDEEEDSAFHTNLSDEFRTTFSSLKSEFSNLMSKYKDTDLVKDVKPELLQDFKKIRSTLSRWFSSGQHLANKLAKPLSHTNDYIKLGYNFSPAVQDDDLKNDITRKIQTLKSTCETLLTDSVVDSARRKNYDATEIINKSLASNDPDFKFLVAKTYRCIVRNNQHLTHSKPWVKRPPRQQIPQDFNRPPPTERDRHDSYNQPRDAQAPQTSFVQRQTGEYRREPYRQYRVRDHLPEPYYTREYPRDLHQQDTHQRYPNRDNYDRDFAPYDPDYKQVKERYRRPSAQGRLTSRSSTFQWV